MDATDGHYQQGDEEENRRNGGGGGIEIIQNNGGSVVLKLKGGANPGLHIVQNGKSIFAIVMFIYLQRSPSQNLLHRHPLPTFT